MMKMGNSNIQFEMHSESVGLLFQVAEMCFKKNGKLQLLELFNTKDFGHVLMLDGRVMLTERDEAAYHEMMVHVPMLLHPSPRRGLIVGGGDGGCLREMVKYDELEIVTQVEIDRRVVEICCEFFPWAKPAFDHPKLEMIYADAAEFLKHSAGGFDVAVIDSSDPVGPAEILFSKGFFSDVFRALDDGGIMVCQIGSPFYDLNRVSNVIAILKGLFDDTAVYLANIPTYPAGVWAIGIASKGGSLPCQPNAETYAKIRGGLKYYNLDVHRGAFMLPEYARRAVASSKC